MITGGRRGVKVKSKLFVIPVKTGIHHRNNPLLDPDLRQDDGKKKGKEKRGFYTPLVSYLFEHEKEIRRQL